MPPQPLDNLFGCWHPVSSAPRDGTPVILWTDDHEAPPVVPDTIGFWVVNPIIGLGYWWIFGGRDGRQSCTDRQIRGWQPLLRE